MADSIGESGLSPAEVKGLEGPLQDLAHRLAGWRQGRELSFFGLPFEPQHLETVRDWGSWIAAGFEHLVVLGMGGSSLGGEMLVRCLGGTGARTRVRFLDNVDPGGVDDVLDGVSWSDTLVLVISKSGNTAETLAQILTLIPRMERAIGARAVADHLLVLTEEEEGGLGRLGRDLGAPVLPHPPVGGRFSVLSPVGLLPAYVAGVDVEALIGGAARMGECCLARTVQDNPAFFGGGAQYLLARKGLTQTVVMPYTDRLERMASWFRQLWAESLGKLDAQGRNQGLTLVPARGATDQHSQLQLYLQGPLDKQLTLLHNADAPEQGDRIPRRFADLPAVAPLAGHTLGELLTAELYATRESLTRSQRPNRTLQLPCLDADALGELILLLETETVVVAELMGVDPFDQPAVEESKILTREFLSGSDPEAPSGN